MEEIFCQVITCLHPCSPLYLYVIINFLTLRKCAYVSESGVNNIVLCDAIRQGYNQSHSKHFVDVNFEVDSVWRTLWDIAKNVSFSFYESPFLI